MRVSSSAAALRFILFVATGALCWSACATNAGQRPGGETSAELAIYFPLAVGHSWTYRSTVGGKESLREVQIQALEGGFYRDNHGGSLRFDGEGLRDEQRYLVLSPLSVGNRWEAQLPGGIVERYELIADDAVVEVPAGRFEGVLQVRATSQVDPRTKLELEWSWARGVGLVRLRTTAVLDGSARIPQPSQELASFSLSEVAGAGAPR